MCAGGVGEGSSIVELVAEGYPEGNHTGGLKADIGGPRGDGKTTVRPNGDGG